MCFLSDITLIGAGIFPESLHVIVLEGLMCLDCLKSVCVRAWVHACLHVCVLSCLYVHEDIVSVHVCACVCVFALPQPQPFNWFSWQSVGISFEFPNCLISLKLQPDPRDNSRRENKPQTKPESFDINTTWKQTLRTVTATHSLHRPLNDFLTGQLDIKPNGVVAN